LTYQNFSGRSIAYTRYRNAATLRSKDSRVMMFTYTRSHNATKPSIAAKAASPSTIIPSINIASVLPAVSG
jgi:hypothetical protein